MAKKLGSKNQKYLSNEDLIILYQKNKDIDIRNQIIVNNIGLIYAIAKKRIKNPTCFTLEDLVQEGVIGMIKGIERFDISRNTSFSTYAYYWIVQQMDRAIMDKGYMIRLPAYVYEKINTLVITENDYSAKNEEIDLDNLCAEINISKQEYLLINYYRKNFYNFTSLNSIMNMDSEENYVELQDYIPCENLAIEDIIISENLKEQLIKTLNMLSPREKEVLELRFGLNGYEPLTLEAIGTKYDLTRERIRQIENRALVRIRRLNTQSGLKDFLLEY